MMNHFFDHCSDMSIAEESLLADVAKMHKTKEDADFTLFCQGEAVLVHSQILMVRSPFFRAALTGYEGEARDENGDRRVSDESSEESYRFHLWS